MEITLLRANIIPVSEMICQQVFAASRKQANHLANKYALEYNNAKELHAMQVKAFKELLEKYIQKNSYFQKRQYFD